MSDEEEDDDADLFADSEKEEDTEDIEENTKPVREHTVVAVLWQGLRLFLRCHSTRSLSCFASYL